MGLNVGFKATIAIIKVMSDRMLIKYCYISGKYTLEQSQDIEAK